MTPDPAAPAPAPTTEDLTAIAQAGGQAAAAAPAGTTPEQMETIIRKAIREEASERKFSDDDAKSIADATAAATIAQLEARGAFETPEPTPAPTPVPAPGDPQPAPAPAPAPAPEEAPHKKTFAEKFLR